MDRDKLSRIQTLLAQVNGEQVAQLVTAVEIDRLSGSGELPYETILDTLRPIIREKGAGTRVATPQRLFCSVFEDLLQAVPRAGKQEGRIQRDSISPFWDWLRTDLIAEVHQQKVQEISDSILAGEDNKIPNLVLELQKHAGAAALKVLKGVRSDEEKYKAFATRFENPGFITDFEGMSACLESADILDKLHKAFPRPVKSFTASDLPEIEKIYHEMLEKHPEHTWSVLLSLTGRLIHPWEIFATLTAMSTDPEENVISDEDIAIVGLQLVTDTEVVASYFDELDASNLDAAEFIESLDFLVRMIAGLERGFKLRPNKEWAERLETAKLRVGEVVANLLKDLPEMIFEAFPQVPSDAETRVPDFSSQPKPGLVDRSRVLSRMFVEIAKFTVSVGCTDGYFAATKVLRRTFEEYKSALSAQIGVCTEGNRSNGREFIECFASLAEEILGAEDAASIRSIGQVGSASAA